MKFYDVSTRQHVEVADKECVKRKIERKDGKGCTYAVCAVLKGTKKTDKPRKLTAFVSEKTWKSLKMSEI